MSALLELIRRTDDDYLAGLTNKGTVKRAYKDLEQASPAVSFEGEDARVTLSDAVCLIKAPLGESTCSCPSRSICRHIVTAILWLKKQEMPAEGEAAQNSGPVQEGTEASDPERIQKDAGAADPEQAQKDAGAADPEQAQKDAEAADPERAEKNSGAVVQGGPVERWESLKCFPLDKIKKAMGSRKYAAFLIRLQAGFQPEIEESSIITVRFLWQQVTVKLLEPLDYSSCSCHSSRLCEHKAAALLAYQLQCGILTLKELSDTPKDGRKWDVQQMKAAAAAAKQLLTEVMSNGLARSSADIPETMERMAVISHNCSLPDFERAFRELAEEYRSYFGRKASFTEEGLLDRITALYRRACLLEECEDDAQIGRLAGSFREEYLPVPDLHLMGMGRRYFRSKSGYAGYTYYFMEKDTGRWYTYTDARPVFYDNRKISPKAAGSAPAPWELNCSLEQITDLEFVLKDPSVTQSGRISSGSKTKAEIVGVKPFSREFWNGRTDRDFLALLKGTFEEDAGSKQEHLAVVLPARCKGSQFDSIRQIFCMELEDLMGRVLEIEVRYSQEEEPVIKTLEKLSQRLQAKRNALPAFVGRLYLKDGHMKMYPVDYFDLMEG